MLTATHLAVDHLSETELRDRLRRAETHIVDGSADVPDYELFVTCRQELERRTNTSAPTRPTAPPE